MHLSPVVGRYATPLALVTLTLAARALAAEPAIPQAHSLQGQIRTSESGQPLAGVRVRCGEAETTSGPDGRFAVALPAGEWTCEVSAAGRITQSIGVSVSAGASQELNASLAADLHVRESVEVVALGTEAGATTILAQAEIASAAGVADNVFRALQSMPGVVGANEYQSRLVVRGGGPDQNLTVMDGVEIHSPYRLDGVMSAFNPETVTDFELTAGAFSARYGDRLSSILVVHNRGGPSGPRRAGVVSLGMTDGNVVMDGALPGRLRGTWVVAARRTYYDLIANRVARTELPGFRDLQARSTLELAGGSRLTLFALVGHEWADTIVPPKNTLPHGSSTGAAQPSRSVPALPASVPRSRLGSLDPTGIDVGSNENGGEPIDSAAQPEAPVVPTVPGSASAAQSDPTRNLDRFILNSRNDVVAATFDSPSSARLRSSTTVSFYVNDEDQTLVQRRVFSPLAADRGIGIGDSALRSELTLSLGPHAFNAGLEAHLLRTRWDWTVTGLRPDDQWSWPARGGPTTWGQGLPPQLQSKWNTSRSGVWIEDRVILGKRAVVRAGLRVDHASVNGETTVSPRLLATWHLPAGRVYLGAGQHYQSPGYEKLIQGDYFFDFAGAVRYAESQAAPNAATEPVTASPASGTSASPPPPSRIVVTGAQALLSARSLHLVAGVEQRLGFASVRVEAYHKSFDRLTVGRLETEQERLARVATYDFPSALADSVPSAAQVTRFPVSNGRGQAYGVDVVVARSASSSRRALDGWISYSYGLAQREAWGQRFPFEYDRRHTVTLVGTWQARRWLRLAVTERVASGFPCTPQTRRVSASADGTGRLIPRRDDKGALVYETVDAGLAQINSAHYPYYARLDARATFTPGGPDGRLVLYLDVINVLNRRIPTVQVLPILPSLGAHWRF